ncbi:MAG TPA: hypothetical protein DER60_04830 [Syntrophomonas sp.]|nr:hypothetical protein [Syntrophomonas sp.]
MDRSNRISLVLFKPGGAEAGRWFPRGIVNLNQQLSQLYSVPDRLHVTGVIPETCLKNHM